MGIGFWLSIVFGTTLLVMGVLTIVNSVTELEIPVWKIVIAMLLIWGGVLVIVRPNISGDKDAVSSRAASTIKHYSATEEIEDEKFSVDFGSLEVDFTKGQLLSRKTRVETTVAFGSAHFIIDQQTPVQFHLESTLGSINLIGKEYGGIENKTVYKTESYESSSNKLDVYVDCTFGSINITEKE